MKLSLKLRDENHQNQNPLIRAKIPVTILNLPFISGVVAGDSSDLSFSLRSNFSSGPNLSLSYHPTLSTTASPFSLSLKSGIGVFGSPNNSPLVFTAKFNPFSSNPNSSLTPIFSLQVKPQFGNFSLFKSVSSSGHAPSTNGSPPEFEITNGLGHGSDEPQKALAWRDFKGQSDKYREVLSGILVAARTCMPVTKRAMISFRWGVKLPPDHGSKTALPVLVVNKISVERVEEEVNDEKKRIEDIKTGELEVLKGMCSWMKREVHDLHKENREMKQMLNSMTSNAPVSRIRRDEKGNAGKMALPSPVFEGSEKWKSKKNGGNAVVVEDAGSKESKKLSEVENELQKAIMAASS